MVIDGVAGVWGYGCIDIEAEYHIRDTDLVCLSQECLLCDDVILVH